MLKEKIETLRLIIHEAEARFDPENADPKQAAEEEREHGGPWRGG